MQLHEILKRPLVTEKNAILQASGKYAFEVGGRANKMQIKNAVEEAFKVTVMTVNVVTMHGKEKRVGRRIAAATQWKKAIVTLKAGDKIDLFESL
ncbi:MAG: 50S ribosomal protein L23 [Dehalococcoidales bacterium]|nr:50S ribosomal protein L23 [Dehalococcoidales bacterium]